MFQVLLAEAKKQPNGYPVIQWVGRDLQKMLESAHCEAC